MAQSIGNFFTKSIPSAINTIGNGIRTGLGKVGGFINTVGNGARGIYNNITKIPVLGSVIGASPLGQIVGKGLDIASSIGNGLSSLSNGDIGGAINSANTALNQYGGEETDKKVHQGIGDFVSSIIG